MPTVRTFERVPLSEAVTRSGRSESTIRRLIRAGKVPSAVRETSESNSRWLLDPADLPVTLSLPQTSTADVTAAVVFTPMSPVGESLLVRQLQAENELLRVQLSELRAALGVAA